jgi:hypothetical protein
MALVSGSKVCFGDASVCRLRGVKRLCSETFKRNCLQGCFSHFTAYLCVVC